MGMKYSFIQDALTQQRLKMNLSIISESDAENNKSYSRIDTPASVSYYLLHFN